MQTRAHETCVCRLGHTHTFNLHTSHVCVCVSVRLRIVTRPKTNGCYVFRIHTEPHAGACRAIAIVRRAARPTKKYYIHKIVRTLRDWSA